jgi:hypothetical protein
MNRRIIASFTGCTALEYFVGKNYSHKSELVHCEVKQYRPPVAYVTLAWLILLISPESPRKIIYLINKARMIKLVCQQLEIPSVQMEFEYVLSI